MSNELALMPDASALSDAEKRNILKSLGYNPDSPDTLALLFAAGKYGLDPLLKQIMLIPSQGKNTIYVSRDGLLHLAHRSGLFDGMEVEQLPDTQTHFVARCAVWRKDMARPFVFQGRYPKQGGNAKYAPEMAEKVAEARSLRRAFDVSLCSREEMWEDDTDQSLNTDPATQHLIPNTPPARPQPAPSMRQTHDQRVDRRPTADPDGIANRPMPNRGVQGSPSPKAVIPATTADAKPSPRLGSARSQFTREAANLALDVRTKDEKGNLRADITKIEPLLFRVMGYEVDINDAHEWETATEYLEQFERTKEAYKPRAERLELEDHDEFLNEDPFANDPPASDAGDVGG